MGSNIIEGSLGTKSYQPPEWQMPKVSVGMIVLWAWNKDSEASPAVVVKTGNRSIEVLVHVASLKDHVIKNGVRHIDDPFLQKFPQHDGGCWQQIEFNARILKLLENFEDIEEPGE